MTATLQLPACEPVAAYEDLTRADWLELRKKGLGGSDAGAVMDMDEYGSPLVLCLDKTGRLPDVDISGKEPVAVGNILEPLIRSHVVAPYIRDTLGLDVEVLDPTHMYRSRKHPFMLINPDGFLIIDGRLVGLEIKTGNIHQLKYWGGMDGDEMPDRYYCQVQHYLAGTGLDEWWTFGLIGNQRLLRIVPRNEDFIGRLVNKESNLWDIIERNDPLLFPMPNGSDGDMDAIMALGSPQDDSTVDLTALSGHITAYQRMTWEIKEQEDERKRVKQEILIAMEQSHYGESDKHRVTFSRFMKSSIDTRRLKKDHPALVEGYTDYTENGRMSVKEK